MKQVIEYTNGMTVTRENGVMTRSFSRESIDHFALQIIKSGNIYKRTKKVDNELKNAIEVTEELTASFSSTLAKLVTCEKSIAESTKRTVGNVRDAADKLNSGLAKVMHTADFDKLQAYVMLLERAASALTTLAELDKSGKLIRLTDALK